MRLHFIVDSTHLLVGWWHGVHLQWEFGFYANLDVGRLRLTYRQSAFRNDPMMMRLGRGGPLPRFEIDR